MVRESDIENIISTLNSLKATSFTSKDGFTTFSTKEFHEVMDECIDKLKGGYELTEVNYGHPDFYKKLKVLAELHSKKNKEYASINDPLENFKKHGKLGEKLYSKTVNPTLACCIDMMLKQVIAVVDIVGDGRRCEVETLQSRLNDVAVYSILAQIIYEDSKQE